MNEAEFLDDYERYLAEQSEKGLEKHTQAISDFIRYGRNFGIELSYEDFEFIPTIGVLANHKNIVLQLLPQIERDKEGLVKCDELYNLATRKGLKAGYLNSGYFWVMLNSAFRRGMHKRCDWAPSFVDLFWQLSDSEIESHILLDYDRVRLDLGNPQYTELDHWRGPLFKNDISQIDHGITKFRPPSDLTEGFISFHMADAYSLEVLWSTKHNIKTFQALEFKTPRIKMEVSDTTYYPARYLHAQFDLDTGYFRHFDGAIQYFTENEYYERRDTDFMHYRKGPSQIKATSEKVFKLNGRITKEMWVEFSSHFFSGNPLVHEYFEGALPEYLLEYIEIFRKTQEGNLTIS